MLRHVRGLAAACAILLAPLAQASFHTFQIDQIYSNADGTIQFVVLREAAGLGGQQFLNGLSLTATHGTVTRSFTFPKNLASGSTAGRKALIATQGFADLGLVTPDYIIPTRFLPTDGGTVNYAGVDQVTYPPLPTDGVNSLSRSGAQVANLATNFAGSSASVQARAVTSVEYYNAGLDHYFISALAPDIDALDSGRITGWARTGLNFGVFASTLGPGASAGPVCRIYIPPGKGDSHFFGASPAECTDTIRKFPFMDKETDAAFYAIAPPTAGAAAGTCPAGTVPVYRVFDNRADANHRYTTDKALRDQMVAKGYIAEGYGNDAVIFCAPPAPPAPTQSAPAPGDPEPMPCSPYYPC